MQKAQVKIEYRKISSVRFESRRLSVTRVETVMNIYEMRDLIFVNPKSATLLPKTCFNNKQEMMVFFLNFNTVRV